MSIVAKDKKRQAAQEENLKDFNNMLDNLVVISDTLKRRILKSYYIAEARLNKMGITKKNWSETSNKDLWKEYEELKKELELLSIFSKEFINVIYGYFYRLISTVNPYIEFK